MIQKNHGTPKLQMFVCTRMKDGECCGKKGSADLRDSLKKWVKQEGLKKDVKVTASLCLGECENGIAVCIHPDNEWYLKVDSEADIDDLKEIILKKLKNR
jgi:(2Fe-2S) ferredoxin